MHEGDNELTLFWRAVRDSAEVYAEAIGRLARNEALGAAQSGKGKLYQVKDRGWQHEQHLAQSLHNGLLKDIHLEKRVTWFTPPSSEKEQR